MTDLLPDSAFDLEQMLEELHGWVEISSPTTDPAGVNRMMDAASAALAPVAEISRIPGRDGYADAVIARTRSNDDRPGVLVLAHLDTVHDPAAFDHRPFPIRRDGDRMYGPGVLDMKAGTYLVCLGLRQLAAHSRTSALPVTVMLIPDEEVGSPSTRELIEHEAVRHKYVLVPEPAQDHGDLITGRWAFQRFHIRTRGRPAHAGATLESGRSAIREMAEQVIRIESMSDPSRLVTLSVGVIGGGVFVNVVPTTCDASVLVVTPTDEEFANVRAKLTELQPITDGGELEVHPGPVRPLFLPSPATIALYEHARLLASQAGYDPGHGTVGGGSDGNFTGALGIATLDGLGACGADFHTQGEYIEISSLIPRARVLTALLQTLE